LNRVTPAFQQFHHFSDACPVVVIGHRNTLISVTVDDNDAVDVLEDRTSPLETASGHAGRDIKTDQALRGIRRSQWSKENQPDHHQTDASR
jgi:hypothetical protein